jgi:LuxR family maltose regulon positive regulatory protein
MSAHRPARVRRAKLLRPEIGRGVVARPRLHERLDEGLGKPLTLVSGPAGCGKTTLLCDWLVSVELPVAWLSLDEGDSDLTSFVEHLVGAVQSVASAAGQSTLGLLRMADAPSAADLATELGDELLSITDHIVVVLDDYHAVDDTEVDEFLTALLRYPPPRLHLVLASRVDPFLPLVRLRARGMLAEVRSMDLRFTTDETRVLLRNVTNDEPDEAIIDLLQERTEGWVAGLRLATLALRDGGDLSALAGAESSMQAFLADEMVSEQPEDVQRFLLRTAVPERLCADLCDALLDADRPAMASQSMLEHLERAGLFVIPLGEDRHWYRYHHLFRDLLLRRLVQTEGEAELRRLHGMAGAWLADNDLVADAIPHALAAGEPFAAVGLVERHVQRALAVRRWPAVERWLSLLPPEQVQGRVDLLLARAWVQRFRGQFDAMASTLDRVESMLDRHDEKAAPAVEQWRAEAAFMRLAFLTNYDMMTQTMLEAATHAVKVIPWESHAAAATALIFVGGVQQMVGHQDDAISVLTGALAEAAGRSDPFALHYAQCAYLGLIAVWRGAGDLARCRRAAEDLLELATAHELGWGISAAHTYLGAIAYEQNHLESAIDHLSAVIDEPEASGAFLTNTFLKLALAQEMAGRRTEADATVNRYLDRLIATDATTVIPTVRSFQARLALTRGDMASAFRWLRTSRMPGPGGAVHDFEIPLLTRAKILLAEGAPESLAEADAALDVLLRHADAVHSMRLTIPVLAHKALAQQAQEMPDAALATIADALALAEPRGYFRTFVDLGAPMATLLAQYLQRPDPAPLAAQLIGAIQSPATANPTTLPAIRVVEDAADPADVPLVERLTERELEVLDGLAKRLSNKEIAEELAISPHTIKRHTTSIYGKLGVSGRRQAIRRAIAAGLLPIV